MSFKKILTCLVIVVLVQSTLTATVIEKATKELSEELSKLNSNPSHSTLTRTTGAYQTIVNIQTIVNNILTYANFLVASSNVSSIASVLQIEIVSPLLYLFTNLAPLATIRLIEPVYVVVLVLQTVLTMTNFALLRAVSATSVITGIVTNVQAIADSVFGVILSLVQSLGG